MKLLNKIKTISGALLASICCLTTSCDFLEIVPPEQPSINDATQDGPSTLGFLYSCYANIWNPIGRITPTDEYTFPPAWGGNHRTISYGLYTPGNLADDARWRDFYTSIQQTNMFLREIEHARGCTPEQIEEWKAEAYFLLAYYHYQLLQFFGPIPIMDKYVDTNISPADFNGRMHYDYVTNWIVETLDRKVIDCPYMPATRGADERGRATTVIAKALKARALLYAASPLWNGKFPFPNWKNEIETPGYGTELVSTTYSRDKWVRAKTACEEALSAAVNDGGMALYDNMAYITETQRIKDDQLPFIPGLQNPDSEEGKNFRKRVLMLRNALTLKVKEGNTELVWGVAKDNGILSYCLPHRILFLNSNKWYEGSASALSPTLYTVEHFYTKNGKLPELDINFYQKNEWLQRAGITNRQDLIKLNVNREPRYYAWLAFDQGDYGVMLANGAPVKLEMKKSDLQGYNTSNAVSNYCTTGFLSQKWIRVDQNLNKSGSWTNSDANRFARPIIRMAELYLNLAECQAELGEDNDALDNLNEIRKRAGVSSITLSDLGGMTVMEWVRNERFVELWGEGHRWDDVRRWVEADKYLSEGKREGLDAVKTNPSFETFNTRVKIDQPYRWYNRMYIAPIQYNETQRNPKLVQAPGY